MTRGSLPCGLRGDLLGERRGVTVREVDHAALGLGDDLLADDQDVAVGEAQAGARRGRRSSRAARSSPGVHHRGCRQADRAAHGREDQDGASCRASRRAGLPRPRRRASARDVRRAHDRVGDHRAHAEGGDARRQRGVASVEHEDVDEVAIELGDADGGDLVAEAAQHAIQRSLDRQAAHQRADGGDARPRARAAPRARRAGPGSGRC